MSKPTGFVKLGEALILGPNNIQAPESVFSDPAIESRFRKFAGELRRIAPKADDFLYFSAVMMHAAEAALVNNDGTPKLSSRGEPLKAHWEKKGESWRWVCSDSNTRPYKNSNGDIFPEEELLRAYKNWVGRPLCVDHKSSSVDAIRGVILDTYYDRALKRVIALCALDKVTYPDLARKVSTGYSTCVSMGTAVGKAICSDCGNVARTEGDFCSHMKTRSCYGEINCDLQPIELSIVVNGADPQAKIRTIIAAANTLNNHLRATEEEIVRLSDSTGSDQVNKLKELEEDLKRANEKLAELKSLLETETGSGAAEPPYGQTSGRLSDAVDEVDQSFGLNLPERLASNNDALINELQNLKSSMEERLYNMERTLYNIHNKEEIMSKDAPMNKEAYFQGGGGVNEPTPGQKKYPVDPLNENLRTKGDKQMMGEPPFPDVGPVDGMHPSPSSVEQKDELERKKMLARAELEDRQMRRAAALQRAKENIMNIREAYFQGGGGVNEPAPHEVKYPKDPLNEQLRDNKDKQMVGQKPFPGVGPVDGLHPSPQSAEQKDELARKKLLQRASLKARFVRVANQDGTENIGASGWHVYAKDESGEKLVFTASVDEISGGNADALFDTIATKDFGTKMLEKIRTVGLDKANALYKRGQALTPGGGPAAPAASGPGAAPSGPADMGGAGAVPAMPDMGAPAPDAGAKPEDEGGKGDPKDVALKLAEKVRDLSSDLLEAVKTLTGEQSEMGDLEEGLEALPKAASEALLPLNNMRKELNSALISGMKKAVADLRDHAEELDLIASVVDGEATNQEYVNTVVEDAFTDAKKAVADGFSLMRAYVKYVRGTAGLLKRAEEAEEAVLEAFAAEDENDARKGKKSKKPSKKKSEEEESESKSSKSDEDESDANDVNYLDPGYESDSYDHLKADDDNDMKSSDESCADDEVDALDDNFHMHGEEDMDLPSMDEDMPGDEDEDELPGDEEGMDDFDMASDENDEFAMHFADDENDAGTMVEVPEGQPMPANVKAPMQAGAAVEFDLTTKEGRAAYRAKLARDATGKEENGEIQSAESMPHSDMLDEADRLADGQTDLDTKPSDDLGYVETLPEQQKADLEVARMEPKVRKEAERLNQYIKEGKVKVDQLDSLVAQGLDPEVVKYWRQYFGEAGKEGSEFGKLLTTETFKAKAAEEMASYRVKVGRAYELANDMVRRGLLTDDRGAITAQVDEIMKWNDEAFESMKRVVAKHAPLAFRKEASLPQVGLIGSGDAYSQSVAELSLSEELDRAFSGRKY
jgi:hypothetical protein